jgi:hypothetical protein
MVPADVAARSRGAMRPRLASTSPSRQHRGCREDRVPATAPTAPAQKQLRERALTTGERGITPAFPARVVYGLYRALPGEPAFATVAIAKPLELRRGLAPAWARQDHTTSPSAPVLHVDQHPRVHRIPHSTSVTTRTPLSEAGRAKHGSDLPDAATRRHAADWHDGQNLRGGVAGAALGDMQPDHLLELAAHARA